MFGNSQIKVEPLLYTPKQAAAALGISERTLYELTRRGDIPVLRFGKRNVRYDVADLRAWIDREKQANRPPWPGHTEGLEREREKNL